MQVVLGSSSLASLTLSVCLLPRLQLRYRTALQSYLGESMRAALVQQLMRGVGAIADALDASPASGAVIPTLQVCHLPMG